jgi:hypothetical protein
MKHLPFDQLAAVRVLSLLWRSVRQRMAGGFPKSPAIAVPGGRRRLIFAWAGILVGLVGQLVLLWLSWMLVDLCISLMELWAELARKHLEITL